LYEKRLSGYKKGFFIAISRAVLNEWVKAGLPEQRIKLIYNAVPILSKEQEISIALRKPEYYKLDDLTMSFLFIGRLSRKKGVDILIEALSGIDCKIGNYQ